ncbi:MAG: dihydroorotate dehydrogenase electron transfer subunit [Candidatus Omnitrophica bacterium]|jgi:dihydroorotate dehydrogenase electron transfer subunit|nr:dihydroorotate dehydrogenase electron transfer subunit [Candidatus Omnitrophota bacterium]
MSLARQLTVKVKSLKRIKPDIFLLGFRSSYLADNSCPGQFVHAQIKKTILRRPFSIHCIKDDIVYLLFRIRGRGTKVLSQYKYQDKLDIIGPLGRGFNFSYDKIKSANNILVAGGLGVAPLFFLSERLKGFNTTVILGAKSKEEILCEKELKKRAYKVYLATEDGSRGQKATAVEILGSLIKKLPKKERINIYACGPEAMFKAIKKVINRRPLVECEVSFEQFMGCGLGICCACVIKTKNGYQKVCQDGPVFNLQDI